jgi:hypothetical protein
VGQILLFELGLSYYQLISFIVNYRKVACFYV